MLDIQFIRQNADAGPRRHQEQGLDLDLDELLAADKERRETTTALEQKRARKNELSALIPKASKDERPKLVDEAKQVRADIEQLEPRLAEVQRRFQDLMLRVPERPAARGADRQGRGGQRRDPPRRHAARRSTSRRRTTSSS